MVRHNRFYKPCERCGKDIFLKTSQGREKKYCEECRLEKNREYQRKKSKKHRERRKKK